MIIGVSVFSKKILFQSKFSYLIQFVTCCFFVVILLFVNVLK